MTPAQLGHLGSRRAEALERSDKATEKLQAAVREAVAGGMSEVQAARLAGVTRPTIRAWLGKPLKRVV